MHQPVCHKATPGRRGEYLGEVEPGWPPPCLSKHFLPLSLQTFNSHTEEQEQVTITPFVCVFAPWERSLGQAGERGDLLSIRRC